MRSGRSSSDLFGFEVAAPYDCRLASLRSHGVALWDVLYKCRRIGSSDAAIDVKGLVVNKFAELFANYPSDRAGVLQRSQGRRPVSQAGGPGRGRCSTSGYRQPARLMSCARAPSSTPGGRFHCHDTGGRRCAHGRARSICALSDNSVVSSYGRPTSCTDSGRPSPSKSHGTAAAGCPVRFQIGK